MKRIQFLHRIRRWKVTSIQWRNKQKENRLCLEMSQPSEEEGDSLVVKGISKRIVVVKSPDPKIFEQAIFILKKDVYNREGVTQQQVLGEACRIAKGYASTKNPPVPLWKKMPWWAWLTLAGVALTVLLLLL